MVLPLWIKPILQRFARFSLVGAVLTAASLSAQVVLLKFLHTSLIPTYVAVYGVTILLSYVLNSRFTFRSALTFKRMSLYYAIYLSSMGLGVGLLSLFRSLLPLENWILPFLVLPFTMTWNFLLASRLLKPPGGSPDYSQQNG